VVNEILGILIGEVGGTLLPTVADSRPLAWPRSVALPLEHPAVSVATRANARNPILFIA
jgi:hypothetical protein